MKNKLNFICILLIICTNINISFCLKVTSKNRSQNMSLNNDIVFQGYFTIQKFHPGYHLVNVFKSNEVTYAKKYISITAQELSVSNSIDEIAQVEGMR